MQPLSLSPEAASFSFVARSPTLKYVSSLSTDRRLAKADIAGSLAHVAMLQEAGILTRQEAKRLAASLRACLEEIEGGSFPWQEALEDVHTNIEARVMALSGPMGEKLHAARSRNDQVALDERIFVRIALENLLEKIVATEKALLEQAKATTSVVVPAYTHLRRAQPALLAHVFLAHFWRLARDADRLNDAFARFNVSPAGAAAVVGTSLPVDVRIPASLLGFDRVFTNSMDATSDRDFFVEVTSDLALLAAHLSGLCEDLILFSSEEFGFLSLAEAHTAGSSLLPNKRNPDALELVRGKTGSVVGDLVALLHMLKGLPMGYHRDLQADKEASFHAIDTMMEALEVVAEVVADLSVHPEVGTRAVHPETSAALLVEFLVARGIAYREAYETVKDHLPAILNAPDNASRASALRKASRLFDESALALLAPDQAVAAILSHGGTGPSRVAAQIHEAEGTSGRQAYHLNLIAKKNRQIADILSGETGP